MINTTKTKDGSWPGEAHALVLSKMLRVRIVIVQINYNGLKDSFDSDDRFLRALQGFQKPCSENCPTAKNHVLTSNKFDDSSIYV